MQTHPWIKIISPTVKESREANLEENIKLHEKQIKKIEARLTREKEITDVLEKELSRMRYQKNLR